MGYAVGMLRQLSVRNLVLIEALDLELGAGFNVVTGETGAGKSMVVDALSLVLGGRASAELVRAGSKEAEVEALFDVDPASRAELLLGEWGCPTRVRSSCGAWWRKKVEAART